MGLSGDTFLSMREREAQQWQMLDALFGCADEIPPLVNIITRTHNREAMFDVMNDSIYEQDYENINQIIGSDVECSYVDEYVELEMEEPRFQLIPAGHYYAPWNLYMNELINLVEDGWIIAIDDDDMFTKKTAVSTIMKHVTSEDDLLIWRAQITPEWIVPSDENFGKNIVYCDITGIAFCYHSKHNDVVNWGNISGGDFRVITQLKNKGLNVIWIDEVLTSTQAGAHNGKNV